MAFRVVTHDEAEARRFRSAALIMARLRKHHGQVTTEQWHRIRELALEGDLDAAEDEMAIALTGEPRIRPDTGPIRLGKPRGDTR